MLYLCYHGDGMRSTLCYNYTYTLGIIVLTALYIVLDNYGVPLRYNEFYSIMNFIRS